jgi:surface antigen
MRDCAYQEDLRLRSFGATLGMTLASAALFAAAIVIVPGFAEAKDGQRAARKPPTASDLAAADVARDNARLSTPPADASAPAAPTQQNGSGGSAPSCTCPGEDDAAARARRWPKPALADLVQPAPEQKMQLDDQDLTAAFEAIHLGLTEVADGATYVWHRANGRLSGAVQPTQSFKDTKGQVCRHIVVSMSSGTLHRRSEGIACRADNGAWTLSG